MSAPFTPRRVRVAVRRTWALWALIALLPASQLFNVFHRALGLGVDWTFVLLAAAALSFAGWLRPARRSGVLSVTGEALTLDGDVLVERRRIRQALRHGGPGGAGVRIVRRLAAGCDIALDSEADAAALLGALARDTGRATASFLAARGGTRAQQWITMAFFLSPFLIGGLAALMGSPAVTDLLAAAVAAALGIGLAAAATLATLVVGADGVVLRGLARRPVFYPYAELGEVQRDGVDVVLHLRSGRSIRLAIGGAVGGSDAEVRVTALLARLEDARARHGSAHSAEALAALVDRGGRDVGAWRRALRGLLAEQATFRSPAVPADRLWRIVEDPAQPAATRAGAAVALGAALDEAGHARLRIASDACASHELREALQAVARDDDDGALERALRSVSLTP